MDSSTILNSSPQPPFFILHASNASVVSVFSRLCFQSTHPKLPLQFTHSSTFLHLPPAVQIWPIATQFELVIFPSMSTSLSKHISYMKTRDVWQAHSRFVGMKKSPSQLALLQGSGWRHTKYLKESGEDAQVTVPN